MALKIPSFGVAKNPFFGASNWKELRRKKGKMTPIWSDEKDQNTKETREVIGQSICLANDRKPVFISRGFAISLDIALKISLKTTFKHRQPEPLFLADQISREELNAKF
jgi:deoxyinosine 3'endonuclease (endonuclease V)